MKYLVNIRRKNEYGNWLPWEYIGGDYCDSYEEAEEIIEFSDKAWNNVITEYDFEYEYQIEELNDLEFNEEL